MQQPAAPLHERVPAAAGGGNADILRVSGDWTIGGLRSLARDLQRDHPAVAAIDLDGAGALDTAGAFALLKLAGAAGTLPELRGASPEQIQLFSLVSQNLPAEPQKRPPPWQGPEAFLYRTGEGTVRFVREVAATLSFLGEAVSNLVAVLVRPRQLRVGELVAVLERTAIDAAPIVAFLSFFVGMVIAFIGATTLQQLGAEVFVVELLGYSVFREFGVVLTGIILAGRTNSAFAARIGAMNMRQETDALVTLGLSPMRVLVVPRLLAMLIAVPVLTVVATIAGLLGGVVVGWAALDINPVVFIQRLRDQVPLQQLWLGLAKAPVFGFVLALIACRQGLLVSGSVQSLGRGTTSAVVQGIFAVIVIDAAYALVYQELGL